MPKYVLKADKTHDLYVIWCTIVDNAIFVGNRKETAEYLLQASPNWPIEDRLRRAEQVGSSALWPEPNDPVFGWNDKVLIVDGTSELKREDLYKYAIAIDTHWAIVPSDLLPKGVICAPWISKRNQMGEPSGDEAEVICDLCWKTRTSPDESVTFGFRRYGRLCWPCVEELEKE